MPGAEEVCARCLLLAGPLEPREEMILRSFCASAAEELKGRLRQDLEPGVWAEAYVTAGALYGLGMFLDLRGAQGPRDFRLGDLSVTASGDGEAARRLMAQADRILRPFALEVPVLRGV